MGSIPSAPTDGNLWQCGGTADAPDLKSDAHKREGSIPSTATMNTEAYKRGVRDGFKSLVDPNEMFMNPYFNRKVDDQNQDFHDYWEGFHRATDNGRLYYLDEQERPKQTDSPETGSMANRE